ncbi:hypothetical protein [Acidomonas methanolica]|uniref:hypothetical protein n=1 Tax=Acidomonas methanolica TaxID=437 RepID=UPI00211A15DA|nr:hypothetical protein [Acidomonas methanolica]MCQ9156279.1 hypothetical protein [Acidomonas methanolica]
MSQIVSFTPRLPQLDVLWAVVARQGRQARIADIHASRSAAEADRDWRAGQVRAYLQFLIGERRPIPKYSVQQVRRSDLPRLWKPLPALGFLRGEFF